ncbi:MAG: hypothetical protein WC763_05640 [Candidatus Paceibacterota bacterium]
MDSRGPGTREKKYRKQQHDTDNNNLTEGSPAQIIQDTLDEIVFLILIILTMGVVCLFGSKRRTDHSIIHPLFKKVDYFHQAPLQFDVSDYSQH